MLYELIYYYSRLAYLTLSGVVNLEVRPPRRMDERVIHMNRNNVCHTEGTEDPLF